MFFWYLLTCVILDKEPLNGLLLLQALSLPSEYKSGKLLAYQLLCTITLRRHDVPLPTDHLLRFYTALHHGLVSNDQVLVHTLDS